MHVDIVSEQSPMILWISCFSCPIFGNHVGLIALPSNICSEVLTYALLASHACLSVASKMQYLSLGIHMYV
jgi:hypothetical protein